MAIPWLIGGSSAARLRRPDTAQAGAALAFGATVAILTGTSVVVWPPGMVLIVVVVVAVAVANSTHGDVGLYAWFALMVSGLVDLPRLASLGSVTALAWITGAYLLAATLIWLTQPRPGVRVATPLAPILLLALWAFVSISWYSPTVAGAQNLLVISAFGLSTVVVARAAVLSPDLVVQIGIWLERSVLIAGGLYAAGVLLGGLGATFPLSARAFGLFALVGVAWHLASARYGSRAGLAMAAGLLGLIALSLSRTALVAGLFLVPLTWLRPRSVWSWIRMAVLVALATVSLLFAIAHFGPLRSRFEEGDVKAVVAGLELNVSGRFYFWEITWRSYLESPWTGRGAGYADNLITSLYPKVQHPHNDYLRLLHDFGLVGLALWTIGYSMLLWRSWIAWIRSDDRGDPHARIHLAAVLALVVVAVAMVTDNTMIYVFVMVPLAMVVGCSLGMSAPGRDAGPGVTDTPRDETRSRPGIRGTARR